MPSSSSNSNNPRLSDSLIQQWYQEIEKLTEMVEDANDRIDAIYNNIFQRTEFLKTSAKPRKETAAS